jgi:excisionase family DNA binding protein
MAGGGVDDFEPRSKVVFTLVGGVKMIAADDSPHCVGKLPTRFDADVISASASTTTTAPATSPARSGASLPQSQRAFVARKSAGLSGGTMKRWLTVIEGAEYSGVSRDTIYTACERAELRHVRIAGRRAIRLKPEWIDAWLERHTRGTSAAPATAHGSANEGGRT